MPSDTDTESEQSSPEMIEDEANRLSDDEEFPISDDEEMAEGGMKGWAGSMAKVLKSDKTGVLSKAKKVEDVAKKKEKKQFDFEIDGEVKAEDGEEKPDETALQRALEKRKYRERREVRSATVHWNKALNISILEQTSSLQSPPQALDYRPGP